jgi:hypothetical protein
VSDANRVPRMGHTEIITADHHIMSPPVQFDKSFINRFENREKTINPRPSIQVDIG